jgi:hypothetical protein
MAEPSKQESKEDGDRQAGGVRQRAEGTQVKQGQASLWEKRDITISVCVYAHEAFIQVLSRGQGSHLVVQQQQCMYVDDNAGVGAGTGGSAPGSSTSIDIPQPATPHSPKIRGSQKMAPRASTCWNW